MSDTRTGLQTDVLVIGAGLSGSATARSLAGELGPGRTVTVVDRDIPASARASSHGSARIFRYSYPNPLYTRLVVEAKAGWDDLEARSGRRLITPSGSLDFGAVREPARLSPPDSPPPVSTMNCSPSQRPPPAGRSSPSTRPSTGTPRPPRPTSCGTPVPASSTPSPPSTHSSTRPGGTGTSPSSTTGRSPRSAAGSAPAARPGPPGTPSPPPPVTPSRPGRSSSPPVAGSPTSSPTPTCPPDSSTGCRHHRSARRTPTTSPTGTPPTVARPPTGRPPAGPP